MKYNRYENKVSKSFPYMFILFEINIKLAGGSVSRKISP